MRRRRRPKWVVIPKWERFQHYRDRHPVWVKNYTALLHDPAYLELTLHQRGVLHGLWLEYATSNREIPDSTLAISRRLGQRVSRATLEALSQAGFIRLLASKPLAPHYPSSSLEGEKEPPKPPIENFTTPDLLRDVEPGDNGQPLTEQLKALGLRSRDLRRYTGCREVRGSHGVKHVVDVLGIDSPPDDWPHPKPEPEEIVAVLRTLEEHKRAELERAER